MLKSWGCPDLRGYFLVARTTAKARAVRIPWAPAVHIGPAPSSPAVRATASPAPNTGPVRAALMAARAAWGPTARTSRTGTTGIRAPSARCLADPGSDFRGDSGPLKLERGPARGPLFEAFFEAVQQAYPDYTLQVAMDTDFSEESEE